MALPNVGGGRQFGDGNLTEVVLGTFVPLALTGDTTLTAAQATVGLITCNKGSDAAITLTLPTVALLEALLVNAKVYSTFDLSINNANNSGSSSTVTMAVGTGWTLVGNPALSRYVSGTFRAVKTGTGAWSLYNITS